MKYIPPKSINYELFNSFTGELYLGVSGTQYSRTDMLIGKLRKLIERQKITCASIWGVDKRFVKTRLHKLY